MQQIQISSKTVIGKRNNQLRHWPTHQLQLTLKNYTLWSRFIYILVSFSYTVHTARVCRVCFSIFSLLCFVLTYKNCLVFSRLFFCLPLKSNLLIFIAYNIYIFDTFIHTVLICFKKRIVCRLYWFISYVFFIWRLSWIIFVVFLCAQNACT